MHKKTLNKIDIYHSFVQYFNYLSIQFIRIKPKKSTRKTNILCIHINFSQKNEKFIKIHIWKKIFDNKKKRDLNLAFLTYYILKIEFILL